MPTAADAQEEPRFDLVELRAPIPGPTVALVAGIHGGKRSAVAALRRLRETLPGELQRGSVVLVPVANEAAFASDLAQLSPLDSLNLNRVFPGRPDGRPTERLAHRLMSNVVADSDFLVDLHGSDGEEMVGDFAYAARPGIDPRIDSLALQLAVHWGTPRIVWDTDGPRTLATSRFLQTAAHLSGVPAITVFVAGSARDEVAAVEAFERGVRRLLAGLGMLPAVGGPVAPPTVHAHRIVTTAPVSGHWATALRPGQSVRAGELLGTLVDSTGVSRRLHSTAAGVTLHVRLPARVAAGTPLAILADAP